MNFQKKKKYLHVHLQEMLPTLIFQTIIKCNLKQCVGIFDDFLGLFGTNVEPI